MVVSRGLVVALQPDGWIAPLSTAMVAARPKVETPKHYPPIVTATPDGIFALASKCQHYSIRRRPITE